MEQPITVYDASSVQIGTTFARRAKQLVGKRRARWLDETHTAIRLVPGKHEEETKMERTMPNNQTGDGYKVVEMIEPDGLYSKDNLLRLAKKKVRDKRNLKRHILVYALSLFFVLFWLDTRRYYTGYDEYFFLGCFLTWGVFLLQRIAAYFAPRLRGTNIFTLFSRSHLDPIESEYKKLKKMEPERIVKEYNRL